MLSLFAIDHSYLIPLLPLLGAVVAGLFGARYLKGNSHWPIWIGVGGSAILSLMLLFGMIAHLPDGKEGLTPVDASGKAPAPYAQLSTARTPEARGASSYRLAASVDWYTWIRAGTFSATAGFFFDPLTAVMLCVVCGIGFLITVFAAGYMKGEAGYFRFFAYLGLFIFSMTILVMANNFLMLYLGWEGVGLCSYLLIGYYYERPAAREAAKKAFLVNRVGDFGFGLGIMLIYLVFGTVSYFGEVNAAGVLDGVLVQASRVDLHAYLEGTGQGWKATALGWIPFLLMVGAFGKSAQFPLHVWLPDAMEGPTPVSALIHAATMVTAGVYMIARCATLFVTNEASLITVAVVGAFTALFAASIALRQFDLKKVFAYSTISQLGFMFVGVGVLAPVAGVFHLVTHAFFKALLFLSSGVVMHAMLGHLDIRRMSGLKRVLPRTRWLMLAGCLALAGMIPLAGFWSKDEIVIAAFAQSRVLGTVMLLTALLTAYYTFRVYFRVFEGPELVPNVPAEGHAHHDEAAAHGHDHGHHNHEPAVMMVPLYVLAAGAVFAGMLLVYHHPLADFLGESPSFKFGHALAHHHYGDKVDANMWGRSMPGEEHASHAPIMIASILVAGAGIGLAYVMHLKERPRGDALPGRFPLLTRLLEAKYWMDEIYQNGVVEPLRSVGRVLFGIDKYVVDGLVWLVGFVPQVFGFALKLTTQRGSLQGYAVMMILCVAAVLLYVFA